MYFPYIRGKLYELIALRELLEGGLLSKHIIPVVEPVKLISTLVTTMETYIKYEHLIAVVKNPAVGQFTSDMMNAISKPNIQYRQQFLKANTSHNILSAIIMNRSADRVLKAWEKEEVELEGTIVINNQRDYLENYTKWFSTNTPRYTLIPNDRSFSKAVPANRVLFRERLNKQRKNADYAETPDEFYSDDHLVFRNEMFDGFSDYSIIGEMYQEPGFAAYAIVIHIVYFDSSNNLRIKHFVSDSNASPKNQPLKYYEALQKLFAWYSEGLDSKNESQALSEFLRHYREGKFTHLGVIKKLSLMHHLEIMSRHLDESR